MCGIIGYTGEREAAPLLLDGLQRLEYRGYDSAGIAVLDDAATIEIAKGAGKLSALRGGLEGAYPAGGTGIGHTRWATHGKPDRRQRPPAPRLPRRHRRHPQRHRRELPRAARGAAARAATTFASETDTEVMPHLIETHMDEGDDLLDGVPPHARAGSRARTRSS